MLNTSNSRPILLFTVLFSVIALAVASLWPVSIFFSMAVVIAVGAMELMRRGELTSVKAEESNERQLHSVPVYGEMENDTDPYRIVDDTQASMIFNRLSDVIVDTTYQTVEAHSVFLYVLNHEDGSLVLQAFRSQSPYFNTAASVPMAPSALRVIEKGQPDWASGSFCYTEASGVSAQYLYPIMKRGTALGLLGMDFQAPVVDARRLENLVKLHADLVLHAIQTVDAVHTRNVLKRWLSSLGVFVRQHRTTSEREVAQRLMDAIQESVPLDGLQVWMWPSDRSDPVLCGSRGQETDKEQWIVPILAGDEEWGFLRCLTSDPASISPIDREALKFIASTSYLLFERCRNAVVPTSSPAGAFDRRKFENRLYKEIVRAQRFKTRFGLVLWTLRIPRDYHGTDAEKLLLDKIEEIFRNSIRAVDEAGRIQASQFAVLLAECSLKQLDKWLNRAWAGALLHLEPDLQRMRIDVEVGVADSTRVHNVDEAWKILAEQTRQPPTPEQIKLL